MMQDVQGKLNPNRSTKSRFQQDEESFHQQIGLRFEEDTSEVLHLEYSFVWCCSFDISES
jgi:hypothetical protein